MAFSLRRCLDVLSGTGQADNQQKEQAEKHQVTEGERVLSFIETCLRKFSSGYSLCSVKRTDSVSKQPSPLRSVWAPVTPHSNWPLETFPFSFLSHAFSRFLFLCKRLRQSPKQPKTTLSQLKSLYTQKSLSLSLDLLAIICYKLSPESDKTSFGTFEWMRWIMR